MKMTGDLSQAQTVLKRNCSEVTRWVDVLERKGPSLKTGGLRRKQGWEKTEFSLSHRVEAFRSLSSMVLGGRAHYLRW